MLESIRIKNYAIIDEVELEFGEGFNVFTGESGVGKSIIVDALGFCLGDKADQTIIRTGKDRTTVEAVFRITNSRIKSKIEQIGIQLEDDTVIVRREYDTSGRSKVMINSRTETISKLEELSDVLVDFHGQHQHQSLLKPKTHIDYLDAFGNFTKELQELSETYHKTLEIKKKLDELKEVVSQKESRMNFLKYVIDEIKNANLKEGEDQELEEKFKYITNYESLLKGLSEALESLDEGEISTISTLNRAIVSLRGIVRHNTSFDTVLNRLEDIMSEIRGVVSELSEFRDKLNITPEEVEYINQRLDVIRTLKRKYSKNSSEELLRYLKECEDEYSRMVTSDEEFEKLKKEYESYVEKLKKLCLDLSNKRMRKARELEDKVVEKLNLMGMEKSVFKIDFKYYKDENGLIEINNTRVDVNEKGIDRVEFLISLNPGEDVKPLRSVASGGEISRIMLAIKSVLADVSEVDMMVFDEIDVGIGGNTANIVGEIIKSISKKTQIIVITHLPQVASKATTHFKVEKLIQDNSTKVMVSKLKQEDRVYEIARMSGNQNEAGLKYAKELLGMR
ncbi:MAG: DNA repair protein RecN [Spirochaetes bacterium]|nr:DNA repair protein RecN [Spirochaetota bacterium]